MFKFVNKLRRNEEGATAIEYGLIAALVAIALITALQNLGGELVETFTDIEAGVNDTSRSTTTADD